MKRKILDDVKKLSLGDLVRVDWNDASIGKSLSSGTGVDVPVSSWGVYAGLLGKMQRHIVLVQNRFEYGDELEDLDYTSIPLAWGVKVTVIVKNYMRQQEAGKLMKSFAEGRVRSRRVGVKQQHLWNHHARLD